MQRETKLRLIKYIEFLESEIEDYGKFKTLTWEEFNKDKDKRRNIERWIENIINSSIDIAKVILSTEKIATPDTYKETISKLSLIPAFDKDDIEKISNWVRLRNVITHEYLDIRWNSVNKFIQESELIYKKFIENAKEYVKKNIK